MSQTDVAKQLHYSRQSISNIENNINASEQQFTRYNEALDLLISAHPNADLFLWVIIILSSFKTDPVYGKVVKV
ncbi:MAG: helix-turn-helix transcriptional regulator [Vallitaleaceae bacterium]|nr:helix-turn-helix transcriptional regulator [Vallitaleaceae bacterium]